MKNPKKKLTIHWSIGQVLGSIKGEKIMASNRDQTLVDKFSRVVKYFVFAVVVLVLAVSTQKLNAYADPTPDKWNEWFCIRNEICKVGDFDGDGKDDIVTFVHGDPIAGDRSNYVWVALSTGASFESKGPWHGWFCMKNEICEVGDFNGDGKDDIIAFVRDTQSGTKRGDVWVSLSTGTGFETSHLWHGWFCIGKEICKVGDFNGDGKDDILTIVGKRESYVSLSTGSSFLKSAPWDIRVDCIGESTACEIQVGDVIGEDGKDDIVAFYGTVTVHKSLFPELGFEHYWGGSTSSSSFCDIKGSICKLGNFTDDSRGLGFIEFRHGNDGSNRVQVKPFSTLDTMLWHTNFCKQNQVCDVGDFNGDGRDDLIVFERGNVTWEQRYGLGGNVIVALSQNTLPASGQIINNETPNAPTPKPDLVPNIYLIGGDFVCVSVINQGNATSVAGTQVKVVFSGGIGVTAEEVTKEGGNLAPGEGADYGCFYDKPRYYPDPGINQISVSVITLSSESNKSNNSKTCTVSFGFWTCN